MNVKSYTDCQSVGDNSKNIPGAHPGRNSPSRKLCARARTVPLFENSTLSSSFLGSFFSSASRSPPRVSQPRPHPCKRDPNIDRQAKPTFICVQTAATARVCYDQSGPLARGQSWFLPRFLLASLLELTLFANEHVSVNLQCCIDLSMRHRSRAGTDRN